MGTAPHGRPTCLFVVEVRDARLFVHDWDLRARSFSTKLIYDSVHHSLAILMLLLATRHFLTHKMLESVCSCVENSRDKPERYNLTRQV